LYNVQRTTQQASGNMSTFHGESTTRIVNTIQ